MCIRDRVRSGITEAIREYEDGNLAKKLEPFHGDATDALFYGWARAWISNEFDDWSCAEEIQIIRCPVHAIFGQADDYGYRASMLEIASNLSAPMEMLVLKGIGHMPHHHARQETIDSIKRLIKRTVGNK